VILFFFLPETFAPNILSRRARRIRRITNDQKYASGSEIEIAQVASRVSLSRRRRLLRLGRSN
jgi:DHA1 family multidrug resistance protein-like MFS transporter